MSRPPVEVVKNSDSVYVGRLSKEKGVLLLAEAAKLCECRTVFVGEGESKEDIGKIYSNAEFTGWILREEIDNHLGKARALVFPSLWYETQGLVVLEAASRGIPAIVSDVCAARDLIEDGVTGLLFRRGDVDDLIKKIRMLEDDDLVSSLGTASYEKYWAAPFKMKRHIANLEKVYQNVLAT